MNLKKTVLIFLLFVNAACGNVETVPQAEEAKRRREPARVTVIPRIRVMHRTSGNGEVAAASEDPVTDNKKHTIVSATAPPELSVSSPFESETETIPADPEKEKEPAGQSTEDKIPVSVPEPAPDPDPEPGPACPLGVFPDLPCDAVIGDQGYGATFASEEEANAYGYHMLNDVGHFGEYEITNFAVQPVYVNDHSRVAFYGVELYSDGMFLE